MPESDFSTDGIIEVAKTHIPKDAKICDFVRCRWICVMTELQKVLRRRDFAICHNSPVSCESAPDCDAIFIASPSACTNLVSKFGREYLENKELISIGRITEAGIRGNGFEPAFVAVNSTVKNTISEWAHNEVLKKLTDVI